MSRVIPFFILLVVALLIMSADSITDYLFDTAKHWRQTSEDANTFHEGDSASH